MIEGVEQLILEERPDVVVVPGDVTSTLAAGIAAAKHEVPVAHVEAGLRSFDRTMPEELNRLLTDQLSELLLIHSPEARDTPPEVVGRHGLSICNVLEEHLAPCPRRSRRWPVQRASGSRPRCQAPAR